MVPGPERFVAKLLYLQTILYQALCTRHLRKASEIRHGDAENGLPFGHWPFLFESDRTTKDGRPLARIKPIGIELPATVDLEVVETEPGLKSATASSVTKPAKTETGLVVQVPPFINEGEKIKVDTAEGVYLSRA